MTGLPEVRAAAETFLPYVVVLPLVAVWAFLFDGIFIGATRTVPMRNGMALALAVFLLAAAHADRPARQPRPVARDAGLHGGARSRGSA